MKSLLLSILFHALIATGIALYLDFAPAPTECARLDISHVDLSFDDSPAEATAHPPLPNTPSPCPPRLTLPTSPLTDIAPSPFTLPSSIFPDIDLPTPPPSLFTFHPSLFTSNTPSLFTLHPSLLSSIKPDYPRESRLRGEEGDVTLELTVSANGLAEDIRILHSSGFPLLDEAAVNAIRATRFSPAQSDGHPVASTARLTLSFKLK